MTAPPDQNVTHPSEPRPATDGFRPTVVFAWLVILICTGYATWEANWAATPKASAAASQPDDAPPLAAGMEGAARVMLAMGEWVSPDVRPLVFAQSEILKTEGPKERMVYAMLAADLVDLDAANAELDAVAAGDASQTWVARSPVDQRLLSILRGLYASEAHDEGDDLSDEDAEFLKLHLRWFGEFAPLARGRAGESAERGALLAPIKRGPIAVAAFCVWALTCGAIGCIALVVLLVMALTGRLRWRFGEAGGRGWVYAESFAVWMGLFFALQLSLDFLVSRRAVTLPDSLALLPTVVIQGVCFVASLWWAAMRSGSLAMVCRDVGLHRGRGFVVEVLAGALNYCMALPILLVGLLLTMALIALQKMLAPEAPPPSHPVQELLAAKDWLVIATTLLLGAVIAPIVEETAFRGMLYRHLRQATGWAGFALSFILSAGVSSIIFATIHPQGWTLIPALGSLAVAFCVGREWRGSLIPGMVAHGINNLVVMTLGIMLFGG
jgi:membrane protease YdiL (CAAX protease family)